MARRWLFALLLTLSIGCTVLSDFEVHECTADIDCALPTDAPQRCQRSVCEPGCRDNHHCASLDPRYPICNRVGGECVALKDDSAECYLSTEYSDREMGSFTADQMTLIGAFVPRVRSSAWLTLQLASDEIASSGVFAQRPLALVACNQGSRDASLGLEHLRRLGAAAILVQPDARALARLSSVTTTVGPLLLSPGGYFPVEGDEGPRVPGQDIVWYLGPSYGDAIPAYAPAIDWLATRVLAQRLDLPRVALIVSTAEEDAALAARVRGAIQIAGQSAVQLENRDLLHPYVLDDFPEQRARVLAELTEYRPDLVVWIAGGTFADEAREERTSFVVELESAAARAEFAPTYLFGPGNTGDATLRALVLGDDTFRSRALGLRVDRPGDSAALAALSDRFDLSFPNARMTRLAFSAAPNIYDALYYLVYGVAAARGPHSELRAELLRAGASGGERVAVGPAGLERAGTLIESSVPFGVTGTSGPLSFDAPDRARSASARLYCWNATAVIEDAAEYQPESGVFSAIDGACVTGAFGAGK